MSLWQIFLQDLPMPPPLNCCTLTAPPNTTLTSSPILYYPPHGSRTPVSWLVRLPSSNFISCPRNSSNYNKIWLHRQRLLVADQASCLGRHYLARKVSWRLKSSFSLLCSRWSMPRLILPPPSWGVQIVPLMVLRVCFFSDGCYLVLRVSFSELGLIWLQRLLLWF